MPERSGPGKEEVEEDKLVTLEKGTITVTKGKAVNIYRKDDGKDMAIDVKKGSVIMWQHTCDYNP
jgi:hypothetical protein